MLDKDFRKCSGIIHSASLGAAVAAGGLAQIPGSDSLAIVPIQIAMIISLGSVFGVEISESVARATLATTTATMVGRGISQVLWGWIPVYGNALNATTALGVTETIGWAVANNYAQMAEKA